MLNVDKITYKEPKYSFAYTYRLWWYRLSRQFLGKNKTKLNRPRNSWLSFQIHLCWCLVVKRLMQTLMVVEREILT